MIQNRLALSWLKGRGRYKTDLFAAWETSYSTFSFHTGTITIQVCSCLIVKAVARSLPGLLNVWLSNLLPRDVSRDSRLPWRPSPVSPLKMRSFCVLQQGNFPSPGHAWRSLGHRSALLLASASGCKRVRLTPMTNGLGAANTGLRPRADFPWQAHVFTPCLSLPVYYTGGDHTCLPRRLVNVIFKASDRCKRQL